MKLPNVEEVHRLITNAAAPCLSLYMPTTHGGSPEDRLNWSAMLAEARESLASAHPLLNVREFLAPLHALSTPAFWRDQSESLAAFRSLSGTAYYQVPMRLDRVVAVANTFHLRPMLQFLRSNARYFLLGLSHGRVSFFEGDAAGLRPFPVDGLPGSFDDAVGVEHADRVVSVSGTGAGRSVWHGQGKEASARHEDDLKFLRAVDGALWERLRDETAPLVVAAPTRLLHAFQRHCRYPHLVHEGLLGSYDSMPLEELHARVWPIVQQHVQQHEDTVIERYRHSVSGDRGTDEVSSIARFALEGRVRELFVARNPHLWGHMDRVTGAVEVHAQQRNGQDEDVLDCIVEAVILHGGDVYSLDTARMPSRTPVAATLRW